LLIFDPIIYIILRMEKAEQSKPQFNHEALNRHYAVMAVDPYALGMDSEGPNKGKVRMSYYSHQIIHAAGRIYRAGLVDRVVLFGDASFGPDYPSTGDLMVKHLIEKDGVPADKITVFNGKDQNQTSTQLKKLADYLKEQGLVDQEVLYPVWAYHRERVLNHASNNRPLGVLPKGFGVNAKVVPIEEIYGELNTGYSFQRMIAKLPLKEAEKMEALRRKISNYDRKGLFPRLVKPILGGSYMIDNRVSPDGKLVFEYKPGLQKLKEIGIV